MSANAAILEGPPPITGRRAEGLRMAKELDDYRGQVFAAFIVCDSGKERMMFRARGLVVCGGEAFKSFTKAWEAC